MAISILFHTPLTNLQLIVDGILIGAIFALAAYGMALVWGVMNIINLAQGEFVMLGGYVVFYTNHAGYSPFLGVPLAFIALYLLGWLLYRTVIFRIVDKEKFISILATFGLSILLQQLMNILFGADIQTVNSGLGTFFLFNNQLSIPKIKLVSFGMAVLFGIFIFFLLKHTKLGQAIRATAQNPRAASVLGIDTNKVYASTFALNAAICGATGGLVAMIWVIQPYLGLPYTIYSFIIVVVAGLGNLFGIIFAGTGLGIVENYAGFLLGNELQNAFVFCLLVLILVIRNWKLSRQRRYLT